MQKFKEDEVERNLEALRKQKQQLKQTNFRDYELENLIWKFWKHDYFDWK